jgi:hypothetical protein
MNNVKTTKAKDADDDGKKKRRETLNMSSNTPDQVSKKIGYIVDEFKCSHNNFQGILYVGPLAVVFLGRILLFEWTVVIKVRSRCYDYD